jgi:hypothetical protein
MTVDYFSQILLMVQLSKRVSKFTLRYLYRIGSRNSSHTTLVCVCVGGGNLHILLPAAGPFHNCAIFSPV